VPPLLITGGELMFLSLSFGEGWGGVIRIENKNIYSYIKYPN